MSAGETRSRKAAYSSPRQQERQARILAVVREQISSVGYEAINIRELAAACGVALKTLYNLYGSKDELVLAALAGLLDDIQHQAIVLAAEPGIPRYLAYTNAIAGQIVGTPQYAEAMARLLFQAGSEHRLVEVLLGGAVRQAEECLFHAQQEGELIPGLDVKASARVLAGHQWGIVLLWSKGLVALEMLPEVMRQSALQSLIPLCGVGRRQSLELPVNN